MMKYTLITFLSFFALLQSLMAQSGFEEVYGGDLPDWFKTVVATSDGGIIAGGGTKSFGFGDLTNSDGYIVKMNGNGDTLWTRHFGEYPYNDEVYSIVENASGYLAAGYNVTDTPAVSYEFYAVQYDVNGNQLWESFYGVPGYIYCSDVINDSHGRNVLAGASYGAASSYDIYLVKTNAAGIKIKEAILGTTGYDWASAIIQTSDGGYAMTGFTNSGTIGFDVYLVKTDSNFNFLWSKTFGDIYDDVGYDLTEDANGNLWILGSMQTLDSARMVLIETDANGDNPVIKYPGTTFGDYGFSIRKLNGGGFLIGGSTGAVGKGSEMLLEKLNSNGDTLWTRHFGGTQNESGRAVTTDAQNNIILAGETEGFAVNQFDAYLVKMDSAGDVPCPPSVSFISDQNSICEDENVFFTNTTLSSQQFSWSQDGNFFSNSMDAAYYFSDSGTYDISLTACTVSYSQNITVSPKPATHFSYTHTGNVVDFTLDPGIDVQSVSWNFGDGTPLNTIDSNPSHQYANSGLYWVILSVTNLNGCDSTYIEQINLPTGIGEINETAFSLYPNPAHEKVRLKCSLINTFPLKMVITNPEGALIKVSSIENNEQEIPLNDLLPGIYLLKFEHGDGISIVKLEVY